MGETKNIHKWIADY